MALSEDWGRLRGTFRLGLESVSTSCETSPSTLAWRAALFFLSCLSMCDIDYLRELSVISAAYLISS